MSRDLQRTAVVEGVESPAALELLRALGCTHAQGYLLGRPAPAPHA
ncbi:EAL domain-containing protein [Kineococcus sp. SYSU DK005]